jgi:hypothetical protein
MEYFGGSVVAERRLSRSGSAAACWWPFILGVRGSFAKRWGRAIPSSVPWVTDDTAARLVDGRRAGDFQVTIYVEWTRVPCCCQETF